jgi:hypothetical protein
MEKNYSHLYELSIENLGFSEIALDVLKETAMTSIGDCIDFYRRGIDALIPARPPFFSVMAGEVREKIKELGYWSYVEEEE